MEWKRGKVDARDGASDIEMGILNFVTQLGVKSVLMSKMVLMDNRTASVTRLSMPSCRSAVGWQRGKIMYSRVHVNVILAQWPLYKMS